MLLKHKRAPASSSSASASSSAASSAPSKSSSSYISVNLPDSFIQCRPATIDFTSVIGSQDESLLGDTQREAKENSWLTVVVKDESEGIAAGKAHTSVQLPGNATSWTWPQVDLAAGSTFSIVISSFTNQTTNSTASVASSTSKSSTRGRTASTSASASGTRNNQKRQAATSTESQTTSSALPTTGGLARKKASSRKYSTQVLAHSFSKSTVVTGPDNDTSCLNTGKPANSESEGDGMSRGGRKGSDDDGNGGSSKSNTTTKIVAALLGSLVGVFATILVILAWQRTRDSRRAKRMDTQNGWNGSNDAIYAQDGGNASMTQLNGGNASANAMATATARDRRSVVVPAWDGGYRNSPSAGWTYMSSLVPGLNPGQPPGFGSRGDGQSPQSATEGNFPLFRNRRRGSAFDAPVARRREEEEEDLPSYLTSQEEIKGLPRYDPSLDGGVGLRRHLQEMRAAAAAAEQGGQGMPAIDAAVSSGVDASASSPTAGAARLNYDEEMSDNESSTLIQPQSQSQQQQMQTVLRYIPSSAERPYSTLETSQVPMTTPPPRAEVSQAATLNSIDRRRGAGAGASRTQQQQPPTLAISTRNIGGETIAEEPAESPFDDRHQPRDATHDRRVQSANRPSHLSRGSDWSQDSA